MSRATFAQWETGRHLPVADRVLQLDELLDADGELVALARQARPEQGPRAPEADDGAGEAPTTQSLLQVFFDVRAALLGQLRRADDGRPVGWRHDLVQTTGPITAVSTAYGLKTLALLGGPGEGTSAVVDTLVERAARDGTRIRGWSARSQRAPRLEATATVLDALLRMGHDIPAGEVVQILTGLVDETARERPFVLTTTLEPVLRVAPDSALATDLVAELMDCRRDFGGTALWPETSASHRDQPMLEPSVVHTARAVTALRTADDPKSRQAVAEAEAWIAGAENLDGVSEIIRRELEDDRQEREELAIEHFTSAWVARALAGAAAPARSRITKALDIVWSRYDRETRLWAWGNGDVPTWMVHDAIAALHATALSLHSTPVPRDE